MTTDQKANKKPDTDLRNEMISHCCGVDYRLHLTKNGMIYYSFEDVELTNPISHCISCDQIPSIVIDHSDNNLEHYDTHQNIESKATTRDLKKWQSFKNNNPLDGLKKLFNFTMEIFFIVMVLFCCYRGYVFIVEILQ